MTCAPPLPPVAPPLRPPAPVPASLFPVAPATQTWSQTLVYVGALKSVHEIVESSVAQRLRAASLTCFPPEQFTSKVVPAGGTSEQLCVHPLPHSVSLGPASA